MVPNQGGVMRYNKKNVDISIFAKFVVAHAMCNAVDELAELMNMEVKQVRSVIVNLRNQGVELKKYKRGRKLNNTNYLNSLYRAAMDLVEQDKNKFKFHRVG